jgi:hypothetical protein
MSKEIPAEDVDKYNHLIKLFFDFLDAAIALQPSKEEFEEDEDDDEDWEEVDVIESQIDNLARFFKSKGLIVTFMGNQEDHD